jgi:triosephosphate isomerase (TIM)
MWCRGRKGTVCNCRRFLFAYAQVWSCYYVPMLIVSNWKAYVESVEKAKQLAAAAKKLAGNTHELVLCVPAPYIGVLAGTVALGAQDISATLGGAATGEVTASLVADLGATYAIVGHSERRAMGETDELILEKVRRALAHKLTPILCVGERERDEDAMYLSFVRAQLAAVFGNLTQKECAHMVVAYEPVWAIGKGAAEAITKEDLREMVSYIRKVIGGYVPAKVASSVRVLYGGSAEAVNAPILAEESTVDGFLVGHASTDVASYSALIKALA